MVATEHNDLIILFKVYSRENSDENPKKTQNNKNRNKNISSESYLTTSYAIVILNSINGKNKVREW